MSIEIAIGLAISIIGCAIGVGGWIAGGKRQVKSDTKEDVTTTTTMIVKLDYILQAVAEIKADSGVVKTDVREFREQQIEDRASLKSAWKAIDELKTKAHSHDHE